MFTGTERDIKATPAAHLKLSEFRLITTDPETATAIRDLDILGRSIIYYNTGPCPVVDAYESNLSERPQPGFYKITKPRDHIERQVLSVLASFVQDFTEGAAVFINESAKRSGIRPPKRTRTSVPSGNG